MKNVLTPVWTGLTIVVVAIVVAGIGHCYSYHRRMAAASFQVQSAYTEPKERLLMLLKKGPAGEFFPAYAQKVELAFQHASSLESHLLKDDFLRGLMYAHIRKIVKEFAGPAESYAGFFHQLYADQLAFYQREGLNSGLSEEEIEKNLLQKCRERAIFVRQKLEKTPALSQEWEILQLEMEDLIKTNPALLREFGEK